MTVALGKGSSVNVAGKTIAFDANVLLGLYRRHLASSQNILRELERIRDRLFLPAQAQHEFWTNRDSVLQALRTANPSRDISEMERAVLRAVEAAARHDIEAGERQRLEGLVKATFREVRDSIAGRSVTKRASDSLADPGSDVILQELDAVFADRTGLPYPPAEYAQRCREADSRFARRQPPGYEDADKPNGGYGDYVLWRQLIDHAKAQGLPVVLVTDDEKQDWWRLFDRRTRINARFELVAEMRAEAGVGFEMLTLDEFLTALSADPGSAIDESAVDDSGAEDAGDDVEDTAEFWTVGEFNAVVARLEKLGYSSHAGVMSSAAEAPEGVLTRAEVLSIMSLDVDAKLTGFTRVIRNVQRELIDQGIVRPSLTWAFWAEYDGPGKAQRFAVPVEVAHAFAAGRGM